MAVEARHNMNLFPSHQLITNREFMKMNQGNGNTNYEPSVSSTINPENFMSFHQSPICDAKTTMNKADSGLTYNINPAPTKRPREYSNSVQELSRFSVPQKSKLSVGSSFLDKDIVLQIHQHQSEIDRFIAQHTEKVRLELEQQRNRQARMLVSAIQEGIGKKLKEKDEQIQRMGKLNWVLQERVKTLCVENQLWKDLAQSNEATANSLRSNLEQVLLAHVCDDSPQAPGAVDVGAAVPSAGLEADDAESSCGSSGFGREENDGVSGGKRMCRRCGEREAMVLVLPCRHLCLCTACGSTMRTCPVCTSVMNASVHVNFS